MNNFFGRYFQRKEAGSLTWQTPRTPLITRHAGYAVENGWSHRDAQGTTVWDGYFRAHGLRWQGMVTQTSYRLDFWIHNPPIQLLQATEWAGCFHERQHGWYLVTFRPGSVPAEVDTGVAAITAVLHAAYARQVWRQA